VVANARAMQQSVSSRVSSEHKALVLPTRLQHGLGLPSIGPFLELIECRVVHLSAVSTLAAELFLQLFTQAISSDSNAGALLCFRQPL
jgi:hypothetical protein